MQIILALLYKHGSWVLVTCPRQPKHSVAKTAFEPVSASPPVLGSPGIRQTWVWIHFAFCQPWDWLCLTALLLPANSSSLKYKDRSQQLSGQLVKIKSLWSLALLPGAQEALHGGLQWLIYCRWCYSRDSAHWKRGSKFPKEENFWKPEPTVFPALSCYRLLLPISWESCFFPKLQCANSHKRTLPCLKAWNSCLESMCCLEFLKQSHTLATKLLLGRATCQSWQLLLLKGKCVSNWVSPPPTVFPCLWNLTAMARIQEPSRGAPVRVGRLQAAWSNEDDSGELYLPRDSSPRCRWVSAWKPKG